MAVDPLIGLRLQDGKYEIRERLAQGGMATVYTAYARSLDATVAIKVLSPRLAQDPAFRQRFHAEARSIANLFHPNIIEVYDCDEENGILYIAMRYVPGGTLKDRLQEMGGLMDLHSATRLTAQVASALNYAHEQGLIHLDVKPANVLLGSADWPLLSDFGILRIVGDTHRDGQRIAGTPAYMSPEQWQGLELDGRSDQYSLALMFYELVTGQRPFSGETSAELKAKHMHEPPPRPREINPGIPGPVEEVVLRALEKRPEDRFSTIGEFGAALVEAVERSRGMQLETKQAIVSAAPNLFALLVLSIVAPLLASLPDPNLPVFRYLTLDWPFRLITAVLQAALLFGVRWHLIGLLSRLFGAIADSIDRFTRVYVRLGTDAEGPLRVRRWRNAIVGSAEGIVNVAYLFILYQLFGQPLIQTATLTTDFSLEPVIATALTVLVLLFAAGIILRIYRSSGPIIAVSVLAICWGFLSAMPVVDEEVWGGLSLQWLAKLAVGVAVLAAFLAVRGRVQGAGRELIVPMLDRQLAELYRGQSPEQAAARRAGLERATDGLVNVLYVLVGYPIIALPLRRVLAALVGEVPTAVIITVGVIVLAAALVNSLRFTSGIVPATLGLLISAPTIMGLPLFEVGLLGGTSLNWVARLVFGLGTLVLFLSIRPRVQIAGRQVLVPVLDHQLSSLIASDSEEHEAARRRVLQNSSDTLVNVLYLVVGYFTVVAPVTSAVAGWADLTWVSVVLYALFILAVLYVLFGFVRGLVPALRPSATAQPVAASPNPAR